jgi:hypothetical protein
MHHLAEVGGVWSGWRSLHHGSLHKVNEGGDKRTSRAKVDIARREQQIVALKLRGIAAPEIARVIGISPRAVHAAFNKALRRQTGRQRNLSHWCRRDVGPVPRDRTGVGCLVPRGAGPHLCAFDAARKRLSAPVETTATVTIGPDNRNPTSRLLRRTTKPNQRATQPDLASDRVVLSNSLRLTFATLGTWSSHRRSTSRTGTEVDPVS